MSPTPEDPTTVREQPPIQVIANLIVVDPGERVLLVQYDSEAERWWLPGGDLVPYEDPLDAAARLLADFPGLELGPAELSHVQSFRGRRGWHVVLHYLVRASGSAKSDLPTSWHAIDDFPRTMHGRWEVEAARTALGAHPA